MDNNKQDFTGLNMPCALHRGNKSILEDRNFVYKKYKIIVELPDDYNPEGEKIEDLLGKKYPYKIGDGEHGYCDLPYEPEKIPVCFIF